MEERGISKTKTCNDLDLERKNFNRYCRDEFQRIDANLIIKLCEYLERDISDLLELKENSDARTPSLTSLEE